MKSILLVLTAVSFFAGSALADPIADRQAAMKRISGHVRALAPYAQGTQPYDAAAVMSGLQALDAELKGFDVAALFPEGSDAGDTKASPKIWMDRAGFQASVDEFAADVSAAVAADPQDAGAFGPLFGEIGQNCGACHGAWRK